MTDTTTAPLPRHPRRLLVTERDLDILQSLATARMLTSLAIEWLHFSHRRPQWAAWLAARDAAAPRALAYRVGSAIQIRLQQLHHAGYLHRLVQAVAHTGHTHGRERDVLLLSEAGAWLLCDLRGVPPADVAWVRHRPRSTARTAHAVQIGLLYAALQAKVATMPGVTLQDWQGEHVTVQHYDRVQIVRRTPGGAESVSVGIQPDATAVLTHRGGQERLFVEVDRGTRALDTWRQKMLAYRAYLGSPALHQRYGVDRFMLLVTAPTAAQRRRLMQVTAEVLGTASNRHLFCLEADVHPLTIGHAWHKISQVAPGPPLTMETTPHPFLV